MRNNPKKIGVDVRCLMDKNYSGVSEFAYELLKNILALDKVNKYCFFYNSFGGEDERINAFALEYSNVKIVKTNYPNKVFNYLFQNIFRYPKLDKLLDVDIFFMPNINFAALSSECKKVVTVHDLSFLKYRDFFSIRRRIWHKALNVNKLLKDAKLIFAVSKNTKKDIEDICNVPSKKIAVSYPGIRQGYSVVSKDDRELEKTKAKYKLSDKFFLYLGNIEPRKNINTIIEAFDLFVQKYPKESEAYSLVLAGGVGWKNKEIFKRWEASKNKDKIVFLGYVPSEDKLYLYNLSSIFVYPSYYEGFGFPPLEAVLCGKTCIVSNSSSLSEVAAGGRFVVVDPYNVDDITKSFFLVINKNHSSEKDKEINHRIMGRFDWKLTAKGYIDKFNSF